MRLQTIHYRWQWKLQSNVERLWPLVTNTNSFNEASGLPPINYVEEPLPDGGSRRIITTKVYGVPLTYEEPPFQWVFQQQMLRRSLYRSGPLAEIRVQLELEPASNGGSLLTYSTWTTPSNILGALAIPIQIGILYRRSFARIFQQLDRAATENTEPLLKARQTAISTAGRSRLREVSRQLSTEGADPTIVSRLLTHIQEAPDDKVTRMRPFLFAKQWSTDRYKTLEVFLRATRAGVLDLSWDLLCPDCRGAKHQASSLSGVSRTVHCPSCNIDYEVDFARSVEATFQVNAAVRPVERVEFCINSPQNTPHVVLQQELEPGETRSLSLLLEPGRYRWLAPTLAAGNKAIRTAQSPLQVLLGQTQMNVHRGGDPASTEIQIDDDTVQISSDHVQPGNVQITLSNVSHKPQRIVLGRADWSDDSVTALQITSLQLFRDLFSSEALRPGESISVENLTLLFTDLKGSTELYRKHGDAHAFRWVMDHFDILRSSVSKHHGALIKTIGDSIMAVFPDPVDAVSASIDIIESIQRFSQEHPDQPLVLKMGVHKGTCIAVTLNDHLDYFGSVVNLAARLEGQSQGNDVILSNVVAKDPGVVELLKHINVFEQYFSTTLKGFAESIELCRLAPRSQPTRLAVG